MKTRVLTVAVLAAALSLNLAACQKKGPAEQVGESLDKAGRTIKNGGKETTADKLDDAGDKVRDAAGDAKDAVTK